MAIGFFQPLWEKRAILPFALDRLCLGCKCRLHNTNTYPFAQSPEMILNKIEKTFNETYIELKSFLQRFQICFSQNPSRKGMESTS